MTGSAPPPSPDLVQRVAPAERRAARAAWGSIRSIEALPWPSIRPEVRERLIERAGELVRNVEADVLPLSGHPRRIV
jgi:hypothetical protein